MELRSPAFAPGESIPEQFTRVSPPLDFLDVPTRARSLTLIMEDPDVPRVRRPSGMFDHWVVWNLPPNLRRLAAGEDPPGVVGPSTGGTPGYVGPAPPHGEHRYFFILFALDDALHLPPDASKQDVYDAMAGHVLAVAELMGRYARQP